MVQPKRIKTQYYNKDKEGEAEKKCNERVGLDPVGDFALKRMEWRKNTNGGGGMFNNFSQERK